MANQTSMFKLGLFVMLGFLVLAGAIIWVGSKTNVSGGSNYVCYFGESVQGVEVGSAVKYQGIDVGKVIAINVAPDPQLIEVTLTITADRALGQSVMAGIAIRGITGLAYIELVPQDAASVAKSPKVDFPTPYPVIPTYSRGISQVISSVGVTLDNLSKVDFAGLSQQASHLIKSAQDILDGQEIKQALASFQNAAKNLETFSANLDSMTRELKERQLARQVADTVDNANNMVANLRQQIDGLQIGQMGTNASQYIEDMGRTLSQLSDNLTEISNSLTYVFAHLEALSERLARTPSDVIFSEPPKPLPEERRR